MARISSVRTSPSAAACDDVTLATAVAEGIAAVTDLWGPVVVHDPLGRQPVRLLWTERYEVWVIGWTDGQGVAMHDHGDAVGAVVVTQGALVERRAGHEVLTPLPVGRVHLLAQGLVHEVLNVDATPATSIHVYAPPLSTMTHYDAAGDRPVHVEHVLDAPRHTGALDDVAGVRSG